MSIKTTCEICLTVYNLPDSKAGKRVSCRKCENTILVPGETSEEPTVATVEPLEDEPSGKGIQSAPRSRKSKSEIQLDEESPRKPRKSKSNIDLEEEEDRPRGRKGRSARDEDEDEEDTPKKKGSPILLILGGVLGGLFLLCTGGGVAAYWAINRAATSVASGAQNAAFNAIDAEIKKMEEEAKKGQFPKGDPFPKDKPPNPFVDPFPKEKEKEKEKENPIIPPPPPPPPPPDPLAGPKDLDEAVARLGETDGDRRKSAADWLSRNPVNEVRKPQVAKALEPLLDEPKTRESAAGALGKWASADSVPALIRLLDDPTPNVWRPAFDALGRLQDDRAIEPLAKYLPDGAKNGSAESALRGFGKKAEKQVVKYLHNKDFFTRTRVDNLLKTFGTADEVIFAQIVADLGADSPDTRKIALDDLNKRKVEAAKQGEVSKALDGLLADADPGIKQSTIRALQNWATKDNVPSLITLIQNDPVSRRSAIHLLGKLKDERGAKVLANLLLGTERRTALEALRQFGSGAEHDLWPVLLGTADVGLRRDVIHLLGDIGTAKSLPTLQRISGVATIQKDKVTLNDVNIAAGKIRTRK